MKFFHTWHHVGAQKCPDFEAFEISEFWVRDVQPVVGSRM
jgi:hypothetical protein